MNKALFAALASVALLGASCSVQDFSTVVMDKPTITASFDLEAPKAEITTMDELEDYYGKYSFRYGYLSDNRFDLSRAVFNINVSRISGGISFVNSNAGGTPTLMGIFKDVFPLLNVGMTYTISANYVNTYYNLFYLEGSGTFWQFGYPHVFTQNELNGSFYAYGLNGVSCQITDLMVVEGSNSKSFEPFALGMAYETPVSGARAATYSLDVNGDINDRMVYSDNDAYPELRNFYVYFDSLHWMLDDATYDAFMVSLGDALDDAVMNNIDGFDYDRDGFFDLMWTVEDKYDAYLEFTIGSPLPDRFKDTMLDGFESISYSLTDGTTTASGYLSPNDTFFEAMDGLITNGLLDVQGFKEWLVDRQSVSFSGGVEMDLTFDYGLNGKDLSFAPIYVDNKSYSSVSDMALMPMVSARAVINLGNRWTCFQLNLNSTYAGNALNYSNAYSTIGENTYYRELEIFTPRNQTANELRYVGVLSSYARGFADGVASRDGEVGDLTEQILGLQEDLEQYQGKSYEQIYNIGYQAALNSDVSGAATFNSLFGNILTAPLTILNGLTDISFFGMPIFTAILSLLMVAMALFLFKRFK